LSKNGKGPFKSVRILTAAAMLTALSVVIGILCKNFFTFNVYYRITFENLPIILCGILFGPAVGAMSGACADVVSCLCSTNPAVNPLITLGAVCVGLISGLVPKIIVKKSCPTQYAVAVALAHLIGQVGIKSVAKMIWFGMPAYGIFIGLGISLFVGTAEFFMIKWIMTKTPLPSKF